MKGSSNIVSSVHHLKMAAKHWDSFQREHPGTKGAKLFSGYKRRIEWIVNDLITLPLLPQTVCDGIKTEWNSDVFAVDAIAEKSALLNPEQRELVESIIDGMLKGETIKLI